MNLDKKLAIIIPMRNQGHLIGHMLESIATQDVLDQLEVIIIDNASEDDSAAITKAHIEKLNLPATLAYSAKLGAMHSRLYGLTLAQTPHILFLDADDCLLGSKGLGTVLELSRTTKADITQYRVNTILPNGDHPGELYWSKPPAVEAHGTNIFRTFFSCQYAPLQVWSKILTKNLALKVASVAKGHNLNWYEDEFLMSLAVFYAQSYRSSDQVVYQHYFSSNWPLEKWAKIIKDYQTILSTILPLLKNDNRSSEDIQIFLNYINFCIAVNVSKLADTIKSCEDESPFNIYHRIQPWLNEKLFLDSTIRAVVYNGIKLQKVKKIFDNTLLLNNFSLTQLHELYIFLQKYINKKIDPYIITDQVIALCQILYSNPSKINELFLNNSAKEWGYFFMRVSACIAEKIKSAFYILQKP